MPEPLYLGIETSGLWTGAALVRGGSVLFEESLGPGTDHNELIVGLLDRAFSTAGVERRDLAGIGVTIGPGMFTSLRVGLAAAKALAMAHSCPLRGIDTLAALAATAGPGGPVLAVIDARKGQVYAALWSGDRRLLAAAVVDLPGIAAWLGPVTARELTLAGSGTGLCLARLTAAGWSCTDSSVTAPRPATLAQMAAADIAAGRVDSLADLEPRYLRRTDAELARDKRTRD